MLNEIRLSCLAISLNFNPIKVITDFEIGAIGAYKEIWMLLEMLGCFFHFGQAIFRRLCDVGLKQEYSENQELRNWFRCMQALAYIPLERIEDVYLHLIDESTILFKEKVYEKVSEWIEYFFNTWFSDGVDGPVANFPRESWNHFENNGPRTSNNGEANKKFKNVVEKSSTIKFKRFLSIFKI